jgi:rhodanese-related sulfurtransferase
VQTTDHWLGVRGARIVVADTEQVRAPMAAAWLRQLGHEAYVLNGASDSGARLVSLAQAAVPAPSLPALAEVTPAQVSVSLGKGELQVVDLRPSMAFRKGHIKDAIWSIRPRIAALATRSPQRVVLVADDAGIAAAAALDLREAGVGDVRSLAGGFAAWQSAGLPVEASPDVPADADCIDFVFHTLGRNEGNLDAARAYLAWEIDLAKQLDAQERGSFRI